MSYINISKEQIEEVYFKPGMTGRGAAKELGITYKTFKSKLDKFGIKIKIRKSKYPELNNKEWLIKEYVDKKKSIRQIAIDINATVGAVNSAIRWLGIETRKSREAYDLKYPNGRFGENAANWRGGRRKTGKGGRYMTIYKPEHPHASYDGYVMEHRLVMEKKIGRFLTEEEIIHHLDGNGQNNDILNLQLTSKKEHFKEHFDGVKEADMLKNIVKNCNRCNKIYEESKNNH